MSERRLSRGKYGPLYDYLANLPRRLTRVVLTFEEIEAIIADRLPRSAYDYVAFWANDETHHHAHAWLDAGWKTADVTENWSKRRVVFVREE